MILVQSSFTYGELNPQLYGRVDFQGYYKGAATLRNVLVAPQGGVKVRFGTQYVAPLNAAVTSSANCKLAIFEYTNQYVYVIIVRDSGLDIYYNDAYVTTVSTPYTSSQIADVKWTQTANSMVFTHAAYQPYELLLVTHPGTWAFTPKNISIYPTYDFTRDYDNAIFTPGGMTGTVTLTLSGTFTAPTSALVGGLFVGNQGTLRITSVTPTTIVGTTVTNFAGTTPIKGSDASLQEPAWSAARGWPRCCTYFQDRLVLAGSTGVPDGVWLSQIGDYFSFDTSETLDADAISTRMNDGDSNYIVNLLSANGLLVFTTNAVFSTPLIETQPITPTNISFTAQARDGALDVNAFNVDNQTIYFDAGGKVVRGLAYDIEVNGYRARNISVLSPQLINTPVDATYLKSSTNDDGTYVIVVNTDGTLAIFQSLMEQDIAAWTGASTDGYFLHTESSRSSLYFITKRVIGGVDKYYLEKLNFNYRLDCTKIWTGSASNTITGMSHLEGKSVRVRYKTDVSQTNWFVSTAKTVTGGNVVIDDSAVSAEVGLDYEPTVVPMPLNIPLDTGNNLYLPKRIKTVWVDYYNSNGVYVDDFLIPENTFGVTDINAPPVPQTNFYQHTLMKGWNPRTQITISQRDPLPMYIRGIGYQVEI